MKPYYEHAGITIYHGDCREVLPLLSFDVLITDPPYGVEFSGKRTKHVEEFRGGYTLADDPNVGVEGVTTALQSASRGIVFPGIRQLLRYPTPADIGCVYCPSGSGRGPWGFVCFTPILFYGTSPHVSKGCLPTSFTFYGTTEEDRHPCAKPLAWMKWAITRACINTDVVMDCFAGSGTTLVAAKQNGLRAIGIEIEERYCEIAAKRLSQEVLTF